MGSFKNASVNQRLDIVTYAAKQIEKLSDRSRAVGTPAGVNFVKDYLDVIKTDYDLYELKGKKEEQDKVASEKAAEEAERLKNKKTKEEQFNIHLYNDDNMAKLSDELWRKFDDLMNDRIAEQVKNLPEI